MHEDKELRIISAQTAQDFEEAVNARLAEGCWRVVETELSVTDHHYYAMLIKTAPKPSEEL